MLVDLPGLLGCKLNEGRNGFTILLFIGPIYLMSKLMKNEIYFWDVESLQ